MKIFKIFYQHFADVPNNRNHQDRILMCKNKVTLLNFKTNMSKEEWKRESKMIRKLVLRYSVNIPCVKIREKKTRALIINTKSTILFFINFYGGATK